jgi:DNA-binding response OmpR family regulator
VLVADDDPDIRRLVRLRLERSDYAVGSASDAARERAFSPQGLELCGRELAVARV